MPTLQYQCSWYSPYSSILIQGESPFIFLTYTLMGHIKNPILGKFSTPPPPAVTLTKQNIKWQYSYIYRSMKHFRHQNLINMSHLTLTWLWFFFMFSSTDLRPSSKVSCNKVTLAISLKYFFLNSSFHVNHKRYIPSPFDILV